MSDLDFDRLPEPSKLALGRAMEEATSPQAREAMPGFAAADVAVQARWVRARAAEREWGGLMRERRVAVDGAIKDFLDSGPVTSRPITVMLFSLREAVTNQRVAREVRQRVQESL